MILFIMLMFWYTRYDIALRAPPARTKEKCFALFFLNSPPPNVFLAYAKHVRSNRLSEIGPYKKGQTS